MNELIILNYDVLSLQRPAISEVHRHTNQRQSRRDNIRPKDISFRIQESYVILVRSHYIIIAVK